MTVATSPSGIRIVPDVQTDRAPVSVVIPVLNEGAQIGDAVNALFWADEVIVVDGGSSDNTTTIAEEAGARVISVVGETIAAQRNAGIAAARNLWVFALDADERATPELRTEVTSIANTEHVIYSAYRIRFRNHYLGRELRFGPWGRDSHIRFFTRDRRFVTRRVHEHLEATDDVAQLNGAVLHYPYRDLAHHVTKVVRYAKWGADDLHSRGRSAGAWQLTTHPAWRFVRDYIVFSGWRDGIPGLVAAAISSFASFLKYAFLFARSRSPEP